MSETGSENRIILNKTQQEGKIKLPYCVLVVEYQSPDAKMVEPVTADVHTSDPDDVTMSEQPNSSDLNFELRDLIEILKRIPRMDEPDVRDDLLWGLPFEERETIKPRYPEDMLADLKSLVGGLERLGKLATLIENAKDRPKPPELDRELDRMLKHYESLKKRRSLSAR